MILEPELEATNVLVKDQGHLSIMLSRRLASSVVDQLGAAEGLPATARPCAPWRRSGTATSVRRRSATASPSRVAEKPERTPGPAPRAGLDLPVGRTPGTGHRRFPHRCGRRGQKSTEIHRLFPFTSQALLRRVLLGSGSWRDQRMWLTSRVLAGRTVPWGGVPSWKACRADAYFRERPLTCSFAPRPTSSRWRAESSMDRPAVVDNGGITVVVIPRTSCGPRE